MSHGIKNYCPVSRCVTPTVPPGSYFMSQTPLAALVQNFEFGPKTLKNVRDTHCKGSSRMDQVWSSLGVDSQQIKSYNVRYEIFLNLNHQVQSVVDFLSSPFPFITNEARQPQEDGKFFHYSLSLVLITLHPENENLRESSEADLFSSVCPAFVGFGSSACLSSSPHHHVR